jgi:signal transduction histidine kinase
MQRSTINLRTAYLLAIALIALLTILAQGIIQLALDQSGSDARVVNIAGRQRMLSQRISKTSLTLEHLPPAQRAPRLAELQTALNEWQQAHQGLQFGDSDLQLPPNESQTVAELFEQANPHFQAMLEAATCLAAQEAQTDPSSPCPTTDRSELVAIILANEGPFLSLMNTITFQYDLEATQRVENLRLLEVGVMVLTLVVLGLEGLFIFRPVTRRLEQQQRQLEQANSDLEAKVAARTAELEQSNKSLQVANQEVNTFANILAHDLRSPISSVQGFVKEIRLDVANLQSGQGDTQSILQETLPEALGFIDEASQRMERLTQYILQVAREGERPLQIQPINPSEIVAPLVNLAQRRTYAQATSIQVEALPSVLADRMALEQIFDNLLSNALKYLDPSRPGQVSIHAREDGPRVIFAVQDNGYGIAEQDFPKIFQLFRRVGDVPIEGNGLGLYYVRNLLKRLQGEIWFESSLAHGSTFYFSLPKG